MAATRKERDIPESWRIALCRHVEAFRKKQPTRARTQRALAKALGVSNYTINGLLNKNGPVGLDVLVTLRSSLRTSLDDLLGLEPLDTLTADEVRRLRELVAEKNDPDPAPGSPPAPVIPIRPRPSTRE